MTFARSFLKACWTTWYNQPLYSKVLTCWAVPFIPFAVIIDLLYIIAGIQ